MSKTWVPNTGTKPQFIGGKLVHPGEGAFVDSPDPSLPVPVQVQSQVNGAGALELVAGGVRHRAMTPVQAAAFDAMVSGAWSGAPSGDVTGATDAAAMNAALAAGLSLILQPGATYYTDTELTLLDNTQVRFGKGATIKRCASFTVSLTTNSGSASATLTALGSRNIRQYMYVSGAGIPKGCRVEAINGLAITLSQPATASGTITATIHPGHNILYARDKTGIQVVCQDGLGYLDGNAAASCPWIKAAFDSRGSGFRFENCSNFFIDRIKSQFNQYHGGFFVSSNATAGPLGVRIGYFEAEGNGVRGLHGRAEGDASGWYGINDIEIDTLVLRRNGVLHTQHALSYDIRNGGCFIQVAGVRRSNIKTLRAYDEYGIAYQAVGNDQGPLGFDSENCTVGAMFLHNCGQGLDVQKGLKSHSIGICHVTGDRKYNTAGGFAVDVSSISEVLRPSFEDWSESYMVLGTISLPASWTAAEVARIDAGDLIQLASTAGALYNGCVVVSVDTVAKTVQAFAIDDPLGISSDVANGLVTSVTPAGAGAIALNGSQTTAGASSYTGARKLQIVSAANLSNRTITITGTDYTGAALVETVTGPNATTVNTRRLFKTVTSISIDGAAAGALTIGTCIARPFTTTASGLAGAWRAARWSALSFANNAATSVCGDIERFHIGEFYAEGTGGYGIVFTNVTARGGAPTYKNITFGRATLRETLFGYRSNYCQDVRFGDFSMESVGRGWGGDAQVLFEEANSSGLRIGNFTHRHDATKWTCNAEVVNVLSTSSDVVIGPFKSDTAAAVHARFNGAGCVVTKPMNASSGAALTVGGGAIAGTGTPVVWVPA